MILLRSPTALHITKRLNHFTIHYLGIRTNSSRSLPVAEEVLPSPCSQEEIADALREHYTWSTPVILRGAVAHSRACQHWTNLQYLKQEVGEDTPCEVEIGKSYVDAAASSTGRPTICFGDYVDYIKLFEERYPDTDRGKTPKMEEMVYLAQNDIFEGLKNDFEVPLLCSDASLGLGNGRLYSTMVWFGPRGSTSPLHFDPLDNLLMQFVGEKEVLLYPQTPETADGDWYYAGEEGQQYNTSPVDVENPDFQKYPRFQSAPQGLHAHLYPGDVLFIPSRWWHHVRALHTSLSVNQWWR